MFFLADLREADGRLGGKARSLVQLAEHGLATPPGFVVADVVFRTLCPDAPGLERLDQTALTTLDLLRARLMTTPWPTGFRDELQTRLSTLGAASYAVRSSFAGEDLPGRLAPGIFESRLNVARADVGQAIREVLRSALAPGAVAYALAHGQRPAEAPVAVLVHGFQAGQAEGSAAFAPDRMDEPLITLRRGELPFDAKAALGRDVTALAQKRGPTEVEWVCLDGAMVYLQARPFEPPVAAAPWAGFDELAGESKARDQWRWDAAHNPLPLSPAQAGLVELVDAQCVVGFRQRILGGYLFYTRDDRPMSSPIPAEAAGELFDSLRARVESGLADLGPHPKLEAALTLFVLAYQPIFGVLQPALRLAHHNLRVFLERHAPAGLGLLPALRTGVPSMASERRERAALMACAGRGGEDARTSYLAMFGDEAPIWDVCAPTYGEVQGALVPDAGPGQHEPPSPDWQGASEQVRTLLPAHLHEPWHRLLDVARKAVALGEADDWLYARTQAAVRRALLEIGRRLRAEARLSEASDVFYLPLALVRQIAEERRDEMDPAGLAALAAQGHADWQRARALPPPLPEAVDAQSIRGVGTGGRAIGRAVWHHPGLRQAAADTVLLAKTLLPTELPLVNAVAIVTETGGPLDHVAAQARERGIPAVVGAGGASSVFADGDLILVDGDAGLAVKLGDR